VEGSFYYILSIIIPGNSYEESLMSNEPRGIVKNIRCGEFEATLRYVERGDGLYIVDAYLKPISFEEAPIITSFFGEKRIFWNLGEDGTLKLLLNMKVKSPEDFAEDFMGFLAENVPSIRRVYSLDSHVRSLREDGWLVAEKAAGFEASKVIPAMGRFEAEVAKVGSTTVTLRLALVLFPRSLGEAEECAKAVASLKYSVVERFPVLRAVKKLQRVDVCGLAEKLIDAYNEARRIACVEGTQ